MLSPLPARYPGTMHPLRRCRAISGRNRNQADRDASHSPSALGFDVSADLTRANCLHQFRIDLVTGLAGHMLLDGKIIRKLLVKLLAAFSRTYVSCTDSFGQLCRDLLTAFVGGVMLPGIVLRKLLVQF